MVAAPVLGTGGVIHGGSIPLLGTGKICLGALSPEQICKTNLTGTVETSPVRVRSSSLLPAQIVIHLFDFFIYT